MSDPSNGKTFRTVRDAMPANWLPAGIAGRGVSERIQRRDATMGTSGGPGWAPSCGARTRAGGVCLGLAMANGRCRMHGGASTGPRTAAGLARMVAAKTTHGQFAVSGAPKRLA